MQKSSANDNGNGPLQGHEPAPDRKKSATAVDPFLRALDLASQGIVLADLDGQVTALNAEAARLLRYTASIAIGSNFWDVVPDEISELHRKATYRTVLATGHYAFQAHDAFEDLWIEYAFTRRSDGYVVNLTDVSAAQKLQRLLEQSERRNRLIFEANPNAMWIFDASSLRIIAVNAAAMGFYGIRRSAFMKLKMGALFPDGEGAALLSALEPLKTAGDVQLTPQICKQKKGDGELVLVELACGRISWSDQRAVLVSIADVTERHLADRDLRRENTELEETLQDTRAELDNTSRDLAAFTYALSNDLQGPLHAADGFATMLAEKYSTVLAGPGRHYVSRIQASTRQLAGLVDDLRSLVQLPRLAGAPEWFDIKPICDSLIEELHSHHPGRDITVEVASGLMLRGDRVLVTTALKALLDNAWKFTSKKPESWVRISLRPTERPEERILQVSDNGTGFDAAYTDILFTAFKRLHSSSVFPGNGLGLAIVKRVADRHGGRVWAETSATGASFSMSFPRGGTRPGAGTEAS